MDKDDFLNAARVILLMILISAAITFAEIGAVALKQLDGQ